LCLVSTLPHDAFPKVEIGTSNLSAQLGTSI
jgi:hypothetical protein